MSTRRLICIVVVVLLLFLLAAKLHVPGISWMVMKLRGKKTIAERVTEFGPSVRGRIDTYFKKAGVEYPPKEVIFVGLKKERVLEVYASSVEGAHFIKSYPILGASGVIGPKLKEGDLQVPEGLYNIESLNPNSAYHLAVRVNYPNDFDKEMARKDGRRNLGGNIMIHGSSASIGCLAMGDRAAEEIFVLVADTGKENVQVILSPVDFRKAAPPIMDYPLPKWTGALYTKLADKLAELPVPEHTEESI